VARFDLIHHERQTGRRKAGPRTCSAGLLDLRASGRPTSWSRNRKGFADLTSDECRPKKNWCARCWPPKYTGFRCGVMKAGKFIGLLHAKDLLRSDPCRRRLIPPRSMSRRLRARLVVRAEEMRRGPNSQAFGAARHISRLVATIRRQSKGMVPWRYILEKSSRYFRRSTKWGGAGVRERRRFGGGLNGRCRSQI